MPNRLKFSEKCSIPALENPSGTVWQVSEMKERRPPDVAREFREFRVTEDMKLLEQRWVYDSITSATNKGGKGGKEWISPSIADTLIIVSTYDGYEYTYELHISEGNVDDINLETKVRTDD